MQNKKDLSNRRFIYISDPSSIARLVLPENVGEKHLRDWVDDLYEVEVDTFIQEVYTQGWTTYWKTPSFEYDARPRIIFKQWCFPISRPPLRINFLYKCVNFHFI